MAPPPQQIKTEPAAEKGAAANSVEQQEETPMEQDTEEVKASLEPRSEDTSVKTENQNPEDHTKMPQHPGRDSDSDGEESGEEEEGPQQKQ